MIISRTAEYALRIMAAVATSQGAIPLKAAEIAGHISCPKHYVSKVLRKLVNGGLLRAEKGHGGGFLLSKKASDIKFSDILKAVDNPLRRKHCIFGWRECNSSKPCVLHNSWQNVSQSFVEWADQTSLMDIQADATRSEWLLNTGILSEKKERKKK